VFLRAVDPARDVTSIARMLRSKLQEPGSGGRDELGDGDWGPREAFSVERRLTEV
jgi:hypothetical protein